MGKAREITLFQLLLNRVKYSVEPNLAHKIFFDIIHYGLERRDPPTSLFFKCVSVKIGVLNLV